MKLAVLCEEKEKRKKNITQTLKRKGARFYIYIQGRMR